MLQTNLFIVIDDETLNTMKGKSGKTAKFLTKDIANYHAAKKLNSWTVVHINFVHNFLQHTVFDKK